MWRKASLVKFTVLFCLMCFLVQCAQISKSAMKPSAPNYTEPFFHSMPSESYLKLSKNQPTEEEKNLTLMAAGRLIEEGKVKKGVILLNNLTSLSEKQEKIKQVLLASAYIAEKKPKAALTTLSKLKNISTLPEIYQFQYLDNLARSYELTGNALESVRKRIQLGQMKLSDAHAQQNRQRIWLTLLKTPEAEIDTLLLESEEDADLQGWLQLALIAKHNDIQNSHLKIFAWQERYPDHPANQLLLAFFSNKVDVKPIPKQIALLLPLSGPLSGPGGAIRDGFLAAAKSNGELTIRLYDTHTADVVKLYQQAVSQGADAVIGPLSKPDVAQVKALNHPVPTLLLNESTVDNATDPNIYQFGLSPLFEAKQVALKAHQAGHERILIIAPNNTWGQDIVQAFQKQWAQFDGQVVDKLSYDQNMDLTTAIRDLLQVTNSEGREKKLKKLLGRNLQVIHARRQDFDAIFLLAYPSKARQIMPLLRYYFAGDVPVFATSSLYSGTVDVMKDKDLEGILFCDLPWMFTQPQGKQHWAEQLNSYNRLYALGMESYELTLKLNQLNFFPSILMQTTQAVLQLNVGRSIERMPVWGAFKGGVATKIDDLA